MGGSRGVRFAYIVWIKMGWANWLREGRTSIRKEVMETSNNTNIAMLTFEMQFD